MKCALENIIVKNNYILKHKELPVIEFVLDEDFNLINMDKPINEDRLPFGLKYKGNEKAQFRQLADWIEKRGLPESRSDLAHIKLNTGVGNSVGLCIGSYALNLADHYWIHKTDQNLNWKSINFFENNFTNIIDFDSTVIKNKQTLVAPDLTVDGNLRKSWVYNGKERFLLKEGRYDEKQEPFNEVAVSYLLDKFNINHVSYSLIRSKNKSMPLSICKCMIDTHTEFLTAQFVLDCEEKQNRNNYDRFIDICGYNGIRDAKNRLDEMIAIDYLIGNTDRHTGNFGIIRDPDSLKWLGIAPIFDNGNSLFYNERNIDNIFTHTDTHCRWFPKTNLEKLELIDYPAWWDTNNKKDIIDIICRNLSENENTYNEKIDNISKILELRIKEFENIINKKDNEG